MYYYPRTCALSLAVAAVLVATPQISQAREAQASVAVAAGQAGAAQTAGTLFGQVRDAQTGDPLQGARIRLAGSTHEAVTNREGNFSMAGVPVGQRELSIDYVGYTTANAVVTVQAGQRARVDVNMRTSEFLGTVQVVGYRGAQARSLSQQRASDAIVNVVSSDTLGEFPDVSVAESVGRIAGVAVTRHRGDADAAVIRGGDPSWTKVQVDGLDMSSAGGGRGIALGQVTSDVLASVEITKAPTPDMDADAIGGTINIVTRGALTSRPGWFGKAARGYSTLGGRWNHDVALGYAHTIEGTNQHGFLFNVSHNALDRMMNNKESDHVLVNGRWIPDRLQTKAYDILRERGSAEIRYDFLNEDGSQHWFASYNHSRYRADEDRHNVSIRNISSRSYVGDYNEQTGVWPGVRIEQNWRDRHDESTRHMFSVGGKTDTDRIILDYRLAHGRSENERKPGRKSWTYRRNFNNTPFAYDYSDPDFPVLRFVDGEIPHIGRNIDPDSLDFRHGSNYLEERWQTERTWQAVLRAEMPMNFGDYAGSIKFGGKYTSRDRDNDNNRYTITSGGPRLSQILDTSREINNFGRFPFAYRFDKKVADTFTDGMVTEESTMHTWQDDFSIKEQVYAAYGMGTVDLGDWRVIGGVRMEHTRTDSQGWISRDDWTSQPDPTQYERSYSNWFPSLHVRRDVGENTVVRASYSTGISRPSFSDLRPTVSYNEESESINARNMDLRAATSQGLDLMVEHYIQPIGLISAGVFYKRIKDVHFAYEREALAGEQFGSFTVPEGGNWTVSETVNGDKPANIYGLELAWDQALTFLPGIWSGLGVFANYSYIKSKATTPEGYAAPLSRQPEHTVNFAVYFEQGPFSTRLAWNNQTRGISDYGDGTDDRFLWWDERGILDLTARYRFNSNFTVFAEAGNLTNSRARRYRGDTQRVEELEDFGRTYNLGVRFRF